MSAGPGAVLDGDVLDRLRDAVGEEFVGELVLPGGRLGVDLTVGRELVLDLPVHLAVEDLDVLVEKVTPSKVVERKVDATKEAVVGVKEKIMGSASSAKESVMGSAGSATSTSVNAVVSTGRPAGS